VEIGGGSIRIHNKDCRRKCSRYSGYRRRRTAQFGFLMNAFEYGALPCGIAFGFDGGQPFSAA